MKRWCECKVQLPLDTEDDDEREPVTLLLRPLRLVPSKVFRTTRHDAELRTWAILEWGIKPDQLDLLDRLPEADIPDLLETWRQAGDGVSVGESSASSTSSTGTGRRSRQTASAPDSG